MEKIYLSDFVEIQESENALETLAALQKQYPASPLVNLFFLKLQPTRVQSKSRSRLMLTILDRKRFNQSSVMAAPIMEVRKAKPVLNVVEQTSLKEEDLQPVFVKNRPEDLDDKHALIDQLIEKFSKDAPKIVYSPETHDADANYGESSLEEDPNIVSETLANIYADQGCYEKAIQMFEILKLHFPEKSCYFAARIESLQNQASSVQEN